MIVEKKKKKKKSQQIFPGTPNKSTDFSNILDIQGSKEATI